MNCELNNPAGETEPTAASTVLPVWLIIALLVLLVFGAWFFDAHGGWFEPKVYGPYASLAELERFQPPAADEDPLFQRGKAVFNLSCAPCHQASGLGSTAIGAPPLVESEWVLAEGPNRIVRIVLNGLAGPITVKQQQYGTGVMTPFKDALSDEDIAAVLTFVRSNPEWKHKASPVAPAQVKAIRDATKDRAGNWNAPDLLSVPAK